MIFMQCLIGTDKSIWIIFDELVTVNKKIPYTALIPQIYRKMKKWEDRVGQLNWQHISDNSAFNQYRAKTGSYDVRDFEEISKDKCEHFGLEPIRMKAAPKFSGSVESRVRLLMAKLVNEEIVISAHCTDVIKMLRNLTSEESKNGKYDPSLELKPRRSVYIHPFDALTYPIMYYDVRQSVVMTSPRSSVIEINA
jgi:hypothetical protein